MITKIMTPGQIRTFEDTMDNLTPEQFEAVIGWGAALYRDGLKKGSKETIKGMIIGSVIAGTIITVLAVKKANKDSEDLQEQ